MFGGFRKKMYICSGIGVLHLHLLRAKTERRLI